MIIWLALFLLVIAISFVLALQSMKNFAEIPQKSSLEYALFLIRQPTALTTDLIGVLQESLIKKGAVVSFERLLRGSESALCVFAPKEVLEMYLQSLNLLEIEDYSTDFHDQNSTIWEVSTQKIDHPFSDLPKLEDGELFMWQVLMGGKQIQVRAGIFSSNSSRRKEFVRNKLPRPFSNTQMIGFYKQRSVDKETAKEISDLKLLDLLLLH